MEGRLRFLSVLHPKYTLRLTLVTETARAKRSTFMALCYACSRPKFEPAWLPTSAIFLLRHVALKRVL